MIPSLQKKVRPRRAHCKSDPLIVVTQAFIRKTGNKQREKPPFALVVSCFA